MLTRFPDWDWSVGQKQPRVKHFWRTDLKPEESPSERQSCTFGSKLTDDGEEDEWYHLHANGASAHVMQMDDFSLWCRKFSISSRRKKRGSALSMTWAGPKVLQQQVLDRASSASLHYCPSLDLLKAEFIPFQAFPFAVGYNLYAFHLAW